MVARKRIRTYICAVRRFVAQDHSAKSIPLKYDIIRNQKGRVVHEHTIYILARTRGRLYRLLE